jgi:hypothetical protein
MCGHLVDAHNRHVRFRLPEPVLASPGREKAPGAGLSHDTPEPPDSPERFRELQRVFGIWWKPEYQDLRLDGILANFQPWGLLAAPVTLLVRDPQHTPYCSDSSDPQLSRVLRDEWPHEDILDALP